MGGGFPQVETGDGEELAPLRRRYGPRPLLELAVTVDSDAGGGGPGCKLVAVTAGIWVCVRGGGGYRPGGRDLKATPAMTRIVMTGNRC